LLVAIRDGSAEPLAAAAIATPRWLIPISVSDDVPVEIESEPEGQDIDELFAQMGVVIDPPKPR
jgi:hypothetical protein